MPTRKYIGTSPKRPTLSKVGSKRWQKQKEKVANSVRDLAVELLEVQVNALLAASGGALGWATVLSTALAMWSARAGVALLGFDTAYGRDLEDDALAEHSRDENRVLLTRDRGLLKRSLVQFGYCLRSMDADEQLIAVLRRYRLFDRIEPWRRCIHCNGLLQDTEKSAILERLEPKTKLYYDSFQQCDTCGRIYWQGSHFDRMTAFVEEVRRQIDA